VEAWASLLYQNGEDETAFLPSTVNGLDHVHGVLPVVHHASFLWHHDLETVSEEGDFRVTYRELGLRLRDQPSL
jgi:hypothetical protein